MDFKVSIDYIIFSRINFQLIVSSKFWTKGPKVAPFTSLVKPVIGGKTSFTCQSLTGSTPLQINWLKDDKQIEDLPAIKVLTNGEVSTLIIDTIQSTHSGNYTCRITNRYGHDSQSTQLLVEGKLLIMLIVCILFYLIDINLYFPITLGPPNWINKPSSMKFKLSQSVIMRCAASGYPEPKTQWKRLQG